MNHKAFGWKRLGLVCGVVTALGVAPSVHAQSSNLVCPVDPGPSIWDLIEWPLLAITPSKDNPYGLVGIPPESTPSPASQSLAVGEKRILLFGDLMPMQKDTLPRVHPELRALFASADLVIGNVESPIFRGPIDLNADQTGKFHQSTDYLKSFFAQFCVDPHKTVFTVANNHAGDRYTNDHGGWDETIQAVVPEYPTPAPVANGELPRLVVRGVVGKHAASLDAVDIYDIGGLKVGVVGWTQVENHPRTGAWRTDEEVVGVDWKKVKRDRGIDLLIGAPHWDQQFYHFPKCQTQVEAQDLIASGFDLIAGSHPSVLQPAEWFPSPTGGADKLAFYSLSSINANFSASATNFVTAVEIIVDAHGNIARYKLHPLAQRKADTSLPAYSWCPFKDAPLGRWVQDGNGRATDAEIVPLRMVSNFWGVRGNIEDMIELVFPTP
jgi:hypothetical protein